MKFVYKNIKYFIKQSVTDLRHMTVQLFVNSRTTGTSLRGPLTEQPRSTPWSQFNAEPVSNSICPHTASTNYYTNK
jgi:hypothetical protein